MNTEKPTTQHWTRRIILGLFSIGIVMSVAFVTDFLRSFSGSTLVVQWTQPTILIALGVTAAVILQLCAHIIRAYKHRLLIDTITPSSTGFAFQALSIGYLFNIILPLRIGELIRAHVIGTSLRISRTVVFLTILAERAVDAIILLAILAFLVLVPSWSIPFPDVLHGITLLLVGYIVIIVCALVLLAQGPRWMLRGIHSTTALFNTEIRDQLRFIAWSSQYGTKTIIEKAPLIRYLLLSIGMWALYIASLMCVYPLVLSVSSSVDLSAISVASYLSVSSPSGPAFLGTYHTTITSFISSVLGNTHTVIFPSIISSTILIIPIGVIATAILLFARRGSMILFFREPAQGEIKHKLYRYENISNELSDFLETFFHAESLGKLLNQQELAGDIRLIRLLNGGSNAVTAIVEKESQPLIQKTALAGDGQKLVAQYEWLQDRQHLSHIPNVTVMTQTDDATVIEIAYVEGYQPYFDFIHSQSTEENTKVLNSVLNFVDDEIFVDPQPVKRPDVLLNYIDTKVLQKLNDTAAMSSTVQALMRHDRISINGVEYKNSIPLIEELLQNEQTMDMLSTFNESPIHGDLTIDNIIVRSDAHFLLLDPNNENAISDPVVDYAKLYQSLHSGYEFLVQLESAVVDGSSITFSEQRSSKYDELFDYLKTELQGKLTEQQMQQLLFHEAVHFCRMLTYRAKLNPQTVAAFYAIATRLLNEFYDTQTR